MLLLLLLLFFSCNNICQFIHQFNLKYHQSIMSSLPNFINGEFVASSGAVSVPVINPATGVESSRGQ
jgi:hypothetical protein